MNIKIGDLVYRKFCIGTELLYGIVENIVFYENTMVWASWSTTAHGAVIANAKGHCRWGALMSECMPIYNDVESISNSKSIGAKLADAY